MFRIIGSVVVYGFAIYGAAMALDKYESVITSLKSRGEIAERGVKENGVKEAAMAG